MRFIIGILFLLPVFRSIAQDKDLATVNYAISKVSYNDTSAGAKQFDVKFRLPVYQQNRSTLGGTIGYKSVSLHDFPASYTSSLHGITLQGAWLYKFSAQQSLAVFAQTGLFSDMKDVDGKDIRYGFGFRYRYKHSYKLSSGWGLAYSRQFFGNQIIPFIDVDYRPNENWSISGQIPIRPKVLYHFSTKLRAGIELNGDAASYRLSQTGRNNQFMQINQWMGLGKLEYQFAKLWQLNFGIGRSFNQSYKLYNNASTTPWTIITFPLGARPDPVQRINSRGLNIQLGVSFCPFAAPAL